ncbi:MAG TPA: sulfatase-like hydrolase/transferase [Roseimicrobium sp.]|nr:sulfatase-like hydrolase/transferase [Roseimicrobium sp.]
MKTHRLLRTAALLALVSLGLTHATAATSRPNILFLLADDMRADSVGALGNPTIKTPNLDGLVKRGFAFRNAYCFGGNSAAVCTPSRNMLLSGKVYFRWKDTLSPGAAPGQKGLLAPGEGPNVPNTFKDAGYVTYHHGKKGNTALLIQARFDINKYLTNDEAERQSGEPGREIADAAITFLKERPSDKPFLMYLAFANPHDPRVAAPRYLAQYDRDRIPLPKNYLPIHPFNNGDIAIRDEQLSPWPRTEAEIRRTLHEYYATTTALDHHIGRILSALRELKLEENTLVVFSADQGIAVGSHGLLGKQSLYDDAMKSPLIFAGPGIRKGESDAMVYLHDIYATLCELTGTAVPQGLDGRSFKGVLDGKTSKARDSLFLSYRDVQRAWRDERWKLIRYPDVNVTQLFDLKSDPFETNNLAANPDQSARVGGMLAKIRAAQTEVGDTLPLIVSDPKPAAWTPPTPEELKALQPAGKKKKNAQ